MCFTSQNIDLCRLRQSICLHWFCLQFKNFFTSPNVLVFCRFSSFYSVVLKLCFSNDAPNSMSVSTLLLRYPVTRVSIPGHIMCLDSILSILSNTISSFWFWKFFGLIPVEKESVSFCSLLTRTVWTCKLSLLKIPQCITVNIPGYINMSFVLMCWQGWRHENLSVAQLSNNSLFFRTRSFLLYSQQSSTCFHPKPDESTPQAPTPSFKSLLIFSSYPHLSLPSEPLPLYFSTNIMLAFLSSTTFATWPAHLILPHTVTLIMFCVQFKSWNSQSPVTPCQLIPNTTLSTPPADSLSLRHWCRFNETDQVSQLWKTTDKIIILHTAIFTSSEREDMTF